MLDLLSPDLTRAILKYLDVKAAAPDLGLLDALIYAYVRRVPWESAARIAKRARTAETADCPRWPDEFWNNAIQFGTGGTCFESNYAFFSLLQSLGYEGYLTINDMGETCGCHTAIVIKMHGERWLVDAGFPLYFPLRIDDPAPQHGEFQTYTVRPVAPNRYDIERFPHPRLNCFMLVDVPIPIPEYRTAITRDYGEGGFFLDVVIINKVVQDRIWRFTSGETPYHLQNFHDGIRTDHPIEQNLAKTVADHFSMNVSLFRQALDAVGIFTDL
jgi:hypothetical protein